MAPARVRGCAGPLALRGAADRQADASRRRNGPRKATSRRPITVRLRSKSCPAGGPDGPPTREKGSSGGHRCETLSRRMWGRRPGRPGGCPARRPRPSACMRSDSRRITSWTSSSRVGNTEVTERFRQHVAEKLAKIEKLDPKVISVDVECSQERTHGWPTSASASRSPSGRAARSCAPRPPRRTATPRWTPR